MAKVVLSGAAGWVIYALLLAHFGTQLYINSMLLKDKPASKNLEYVNYYNMGANIVIVVVLLYLGFKALSA